MFYGIYIIIINYYNNIIYILLFHITTWNHWAFLCTCVCTDFDEQCSQEDDWDVCMSLYYDRGQFCNRTLLYTDNYLLHMCACSHPHSVPSDDHNKYNVIIILCVQTVGTGMHVI